MGLISKIKDALSKTSEKISLSIMGKKIDANFYETIEEALIMADVGASTAQELAQKIANIKFHESTTDTEIKDRLAQEITKILHPLELNIIDQIKAHQASAEKHKPYVIMVIGVNGNGKTTTIAKLANLIKNSGFSTSLIACDTFRAAAIEQITHWAHKINIPIYTSTEQLDPASVAYKGMEFSMNLQSDVVLIDTAGRMHNREDLLEELKKIKRVVQKIDTNAPHFTALVLDGLTGQASHSQVNVFLEKIGIDGLIITKLDGTAKGGAVISLGETYKIPIIAIGIGESLSDIKPFEASEYANAILRI